LECAFKYKQAGAKVVVMANDASSLGASKIALGDEHDIVFGDVSVATDVER